MALSDFFRINLPYGIRSNEKGEWMAFNREYVPLGYNHPSLITQSIFSTEFCANLPIHTKYKGLTENKLKMIFGEDNIQKSGDIITAVFYNDRTNPMNSNKQDDWENYFLKIKHLSQFIAQ